VGDRKPRAGNSPTHAAEHLGTTDKAIVSYRRMLLSAIGQGGPTRAKKPPMWPLDRHAAGRDPRTHRHRRHGSDEGCRVLLWKGRFDKARRPQRLPEAGAKTIPPLGPRRPQ